MGDVGAVMVISSMIAFFSSYFPRLMQANAYSESNALTTGEEGWHFQEKAWKEILQVLVEQAGEVEEIVGEPN